MRRVVSIRYSRKGLLIFGGWTIFAVFYTSQTFIEQTSGHGDSTFWRALLLRLTFSYAWAALSIAVLALARRFRIGGSKWPGNLLLHIAIGSFFAVFQLGVYALIYCLLWCDLSVAVFTLRFRNLLIAEFHFNYLIYWALLGISHGLWYYGRLRDRELLSSQLELKASQLEAQLAQAHLETLKTQLRPHFLFNTLQTISVYMLDDVEKANRMLIGLSDMLRATLKSVGRQEVSLKQELALLHNYLEIEQIRFEDRLSIKMDVDPMVLDAQVPNLVFQPLVENAIRHGIAPRARGGRIEIRAARLNGTLRLEVHDDGVGLQDSYLTGVGHGLGLTNTQARLQRLYGGEHSFLLTEADCGGVDVIIEIPFRSEADAAQPEGRKNGKDQSAYRRG